MRYLFALGGNAFSEKNLVLFSRVISSLYRKGNDIIISHGNGPQVGELYLEEGKNLALLTAQTEAELGVEIERALLSAVKSNKVAIVLTRTLVDKNDEEFRRPTKPIGKFYGRRESVPIGNRNFKVRKLAKGYRLVVPSPKPLEILEKEEILELLSQRYIVISAGGGGVAVTKSDKQMRFADAVIDKDLASSLLAVKIKADRFFILTNVDFAYTDFGGKEQTPIKRIGVKKAREYLKRNYFEEGSMKPKIEACIEFVKKTRKIAAIGNISKIQRVIDMRSTVILP